MNYSIIYRNNGGPEEMDFLPAFVSGCSEFESQSGRHQKHYTQTSQQTVTYLAGFLVLGLSLGFLGRPYPYDCRGACRCRCRL